MIVSRQPFANGTVFEHLPIDPGVHDVGYLIRQPGQDTIATGYTSPGMVTFLAAMDALIDSLTDRLDALDTHAVGTAYLRIIDAGTPWYPGRFHYDTGLDTEAPRGGLQVLRFTAALSSDDRPVANFFSTNPDHVGQLVADVLGREPRSLTQPPNGHITVFSEGNDLHGHLATPARPGETTAFMSATLYRAAQPIDLDVLETHRPNCPVTSLRR